MNWVFPRKPEDVATLGNLFLSQGYTDKYEFAGHIYVLFYLMI